MGIFNRIFGSAVEGARKSERPSWDSFFCPLCFSIFRKMQVDPAYPMCGDCSSEGLDFELVPFGEFLGQTSVERLHEIERDWAQSTEFLESYKTAKAARIQSVIGWKREYDLEHPDAP